MNRPPCITLLAAAAVVFALAALAFAAGRYPVAVADVMRVLWSWLGGAPHGLDPAVETVVLQIRGPRVLSALLVGAALAAAGAAYQNLFRNPLVSPDILGVSAGAAVGAVLGIFLSLGVVMIQGMAFAGGLLAVALVYFTARALAQAATLMVMDEPTANLDFGNQLRVLERIRALA
ncbi:MAG: iron chelate uptake ABC transporter family permease subunit, partial [Betaproteobacteria bacterium]